MRQAYGWVVLGACTFAAAAFLAVLIATALRGP